MESSLSILSWPSVTVPLLVPVLTLIQSTTGFEWRVVQAQLDKFSIPPKKVIGIIKSTTRSIRTHASPSSLSTARMRTIRGYRAVIAADVAHLGAIARTHSVFKQLYSQNFEHQT